MGGLIILTNGRTLLGSDWIAATGTAQTTITATIVVCWIGAVAYSIREYRRERESADAIDAEVAARPAAERAAR